MSDKEYILKNDMSLNSIKEDETDNEKININLRQIRRQPSQSQILQSQQKKNQQLPGLILHNSELSLVKVVKDYREIKDEISRWEQLVILCSILLIIIGTFFTFYSFFGFLLNTMPLIVYFSIYSEQFIQNVSKVVQSQLKITIILNVLNLLLSVMALMFGCCSLCLKFKKDLFYAKFLRKYSIVVIATFDVILLINGILGNFYLYQTIDELQSIGYEDATSNDQITSMIVMIILTLSSMVLGTIACLGCRKSFSKFGNSIQSYNEFLLKYEETPRSKMLKKYHPPLDTLIEVTSVYENAQSVISRNTMFNNRMTGETFHSITVESDSSPYQEHFRTSLNDNN